MELDILKKARDFANQIQETDIQAFLLKNQKKIEHHLLRLIADQWIARQKARFKLPEWYANAEVIFPPPLSVEQASSAVTATYKADIFASPSYNTIADLTGGMGIDTCAFARTHKQVMYIERNPAVACVAAHNFAALGYNNIKVANQEASDFLKTETLLAQTHFYLDPARRDTAQNKVFKIEDCEPDLLSIKAVLGEYMVKYSPMLDIKLAIEQLKGIGQIHVVAVENEVKELLFLSRAASDTPQITCVNFLADATRQSFVFDYATEQAASTTYVLPQKYIYEPNAAILKAGAFKSIAQVFGLNKLAPNSHLYTADTLMAGFPGRVFECEAVCKFDKKEILSKLPYNQANITTRNFPIKPDEIRKKLGIKDGGDTYLLATENYQHQKIVLVCKKILNL
ncbi:THUMP-like domain-containing protein [Emticicia sp. 17c]|uniref:THUMP-like domain-containing protein n=1 Tax=Emticicia sp. 17c TaxID=3127704 RepID=UPI00301B93B2